MDVFNRFKGEKFKKYVKILRVDTFSTSGHVCSQSVSQPLRRQTVHLFDK